MQKAATTFHNRTAIFFWGFAIVWLAMLSAMTLELASDGPPPELTATGMAAILLVFWIGGCGLVAYVSSKPCVTVSVMPGDSIACSRRYPFRKEQWRYSTAGISGAQLVESEDSDGDPYFYARISAPNGHSFDIAEAHSREYCEQVCGQFNRALAA